nr:family 10 glycosylhydrolase [Geofilum rubicundum]
MTTMRIVRILLVVVFPILLFQNAHSTPSTAIYEFRGVWVATVTNIDWPSKPGLSVGALKKEALDIITTHHAMGMNAIILQVRPAGDAIYPTALAPWSKYLTGEQGKPLDGSFDLLKFWIEECHKRDMELHAWINPFRASLHSDDPLHISHPALIHPNWTVVHNKRLYYNPALPEVRQHIIQVITDLVSRYDIDGLHMDDYFYPYPANGEAFNDTATYINQLDYEAPLSIHDWRRNNIDLFIEEANRVIHRVKPWVKFGISLLGYGAT